MTVKRMAGIAGAAALAGLFLFTLAWGADAVKIGYSGPLSGGAAKYGKNCEAGMIMAAEEVNAKGGISVAGKKLKMEIVSLDDRYKPDLTVQNARRMVSLDKVSSVFCPHSGGILAMMNFNEKEGFVVMGYSTHPKIVEVGNKLIIRLPPDVRAYASAFSDKAKEKGIKKVAALPGVHEYAKIWTDIFKEEWAKRGGTITDVSPADYMKETDFYTHLTKVIAGKPDAILLVGASEPTGLIVKQARELGYGGKFILGDQAKLDEMTKVVSIDKMEGTIAVTPLYHRPIKDAPTFTKAYQKRFGEGEVSTFEAASHYESVYILAYAMEAAGTISDAAAIRSAMPKVFPLEKRGTLAPTGVFSIRDNGAQLRVTYGTEVSGGKWTEPFGIKY
ncbi:MAG TPA: ABC transporter substrate-binding protein [Thermodesulfobacteriota bacterium]|nr:ABC transporter substrate-binding protein [Thermodesulfobacteriota bacterium]